MERPLSFLDSFQNYEKTVHVRYPESFSLDRVREFLNELENPHQKYPILHVAGTKGKGSTCAFAASILRSAGWRVGLYTSPHLISFQERIRIDGEPISEEALARIVEEIKPFTSPKLTYFEVTTACAFLYFAQAQIDAAVVEAGLGGRLDATNLVDPSATAITPISLDHMRQLGNSLEKIAREKAGIIKPGIPVVVAPQSAEAFRVLQSTALLRKTPLHILEEEVQVEKKALSAQGSRISLRTPVQFYSELFVPLPGHHQTTNVATAIRMVELFGHRLHRRRLSPSTVREGVSRTVWEGRCQFIPGAPDLFLDGAHNAVSALLLKETVEELFPGRRVTLLVGMSQEKDLEGMAMVFGPWAHQLFLTQAHHPRAESTERVAESFRPWHLHPWIVPSTEEALHQAQQRSDPRDLLVVTGSLFIVGEALQSLRLSTPVNQQLSP